MHSGLRSILIFFALLCAGCRNETIRSTYVEMPPTDDNTFNARGAAPSLVEGDSKQITLTVRNDTSYLYLSGKSANVDAAKALARGGITIWISPEKHNVKQIEFHYPSSGVGRYGEASITRGGFWRSMTDSEQIRARAALETRHDELVVYDHRNNDAKLFPPGNTDGFVMATKKSGSMDDSSAQYYFSARIPLHLDRYFSESPSLADRGTINLGIGIPATPSEGDRTRMPKGRGFGGIGDGGYGGGYGGRGDFDRSRGGRRMMPPAGSGSMTEIWFEVTLAKPQ